MKRKFKILIFAISIFIMLSAFALVSNAEETNNDIPSYNSTSYHIFYSPFNEPYEDAVSFDGYLIELSFHEILFPYGDNQHLYFCYISYPEGLIVDPFSLQDFCSLYNISDFNEFIEKIDELYFGYTETSEGVHVYDHPDFHERYLYEYECLSYSSGLNEPFLAALNYSKITQEDVNEAIAKALEEAGVVSNDGWVIESLPKDIIKLETESSGYKVLYTQDMNLNFFRFGIQHGTGNIDYKFAFVPSEFQDFVNSITKNSPTYENFKNALIDLNSKVQSGEYTDDPAGLYDIFNYNTNDSLYLSEDSFEYFMNFNSSMLTDEDLQDKYDEGKVDGVEEFKSSEEYTNILNNKYSTGYTEGIESFKASTAYTDALDLEYSNGKVAGVNDFKASVEFKNTLKAQYNEGYDNGVSDTQGVNAKNETTKLISILIGVLGFGILFMAVLSGVGAFKKKRVNRR